MVDVTESNFCKPLRLINWSLSTTSKKNPVLKFIPFYFIRRLGNKEALCVCVDLDVSRIDGDFAVSAFLSLDLDGQEEQLQFCEA